MSQQTSGLVLTKLDRRPRKSRSERGSELVEFALVLLPLFALVFLSFDTAWVIFIRAALQEAVREGVRFGITGQSMSGACLDASIQQVVKTYSFGFVKSPGQVSIAYYSPFNPGTNLAGTPGATAGGNILQVSINGVSVRSVAPLWRSATPLNLSATAVDVMETSPSNFPPCE